MKEIDFVILWVDGNEPVWRKQFESYAHIASKENKKAVRYRDWENLQYWFRGVEKFAPWVRYIHFVTEGHLPKWLNTECPKLRIVKHIDIIPEKHLPLFNSSAIELYIHRIPDLAEQFVYFNDDLFIIDHISEKFFFRNNLPCDMAVCNAISGGGIAHTIIEELRIINEYFKKREIIKQNFSKWINLKYGFHLLRTLLLLPWPRFTGFFDPHMPTPYLKSIYESTFHLNIEAVERTSKNRFRAYEDINQYLFRYWQLLTGKFTPYNFTNQVLYCELKDTEVDRIGLVIRNQKKKIIALNDSDSIRDFEFLKNGINNCFESILPDKSTFEK